MHSPASTHRQGRRQLGGHAEAATWPAAGGEKSRRAKTSLRPLEAARSMSRPVVAEGQAQVHGPLRSGGWPGPSCRSTVPVPQKELVATGHRCRCDRWQVAYRGPRNPPRGEPSRHHAAPPRASTHDPPSRRRAESTAVFPGARRRPAPSSSPADGEGSGAESQAQPRGQRQDQLRTHPLGTVVVRPANGIRCQGFLRS